jgi:hypothetical protein
MRSVTIPGLAVLAVLAVGVSACGSGPVEATAQRPVIRSTDSSWVTGQISMAELAAFQTISGPALKLAQERAQERKRELALLEARRIAARKRAQEEARRKYREALRRAREKYRLALKKAAEERRRRLAELRRKKAELERRRRELEEKLKVPVGEECRDPAQRRRYRCSTGRLPVPATQPIR